MKMSKVETTYNTLVQLSQVVDPLTGVVIQVRMPVKAAYNIGRNLQKLEKDYAFCQEQRNAIIKDLYIPHPTIPNQFVPNPKDPEAGPKEIQELYDQEVDISLDTMYKLTLAEFGDKVEPTPAMMMELDWMIVEPVSPVEK